VGKAQRAHQAFTARRWWARRKRAFAHPTTSSLFETVDQKPNKLTVVARGPRRVSANRSPPLVAELP
jgi:hypothetical protein